MTNNLLKRLLSGAAVLYVIALLLLVITSIGYPYSFDWIEGGMVDHVRWLLSGKPLYAKPSLEFTSFVYQPLYIYISALASRFFGVGFPALRVVSLASMAGTFGVIYLFVKRENGGAYYGILACGAFAACEALTGAPMQMARVDDLFLFLFMTAVFLVRFHASRMGYIVAGALFAFSFLTKQTALVASLPILIYSVITERRKSLYLIVTFAVISGGSVLMLDRIYDGWYSYYTFILPGRIPFEPSMYTVFLRQDMMWPLSIACMFSLFFIVSNLAFEKKTGLFYMLAAAGMLGGSWLSRLNSLSFSNVSLPAYCMISILFALGVSEAAKTIPTSTQTRGKLVENFIYSISIIQLLLLLYNPFDFIPSKKDMDAGAEFVKTMSQFKGEIFVPYHSYIPTYAGKRTYSHYMALFEQLREGDASIRTDLINEMRQAINEKRFDAIFIRPDIFAEGLMTPEDLKRNYNVAGETSYGGTKLWNSDTDKVELLLVRKHD